MLGWLVLGEAAALAADAPSLWVRGFSAITVQPVGIIADGAAELRAPVLRLGGVAFNDTFVGAGARAAVTPVHAEGAVRVDAQLIDLLPITVEGIYEVFWESPWGMTPAATADHQRGADRKPLYDADRDFAATALALSVAPTFQIRLGPVVGFTSPSFTWIRYRPVQQPEPWLFDPYRGIVAGYDDRLLEHTSAVLWEPLDGEEGALFRIGPVFRGKSGHASGDLSLTAGGVAQWRPKPAAPTFLFVAAAYLVDADWAGPIPYLAAVMTFERDILLGKGGADRGLPDL